MLLPWERPLWTGRPFGSADVGYTLTDFRLIADAGASLQPAGRADVDEILLDDISDVEVSQAFAERLIGAATLVVRHRDARRPPLVLYRVRRGRQLAAVLMLLAGSPRPALDAEGVGAALAWTSAPMGPRARALAAASLAAAAVTLGVAIGAITIRGESPAIVFPSDDAIYPGGFKRDQVAIVAFMEQDVMPWARQALAPIVGGPDRVSCATCHGPDAVSQGWRMPAVGVLPEPDVRTLGWETHSPGMDPQLRNAIYGYAADAERQSKAAYMREVIMPGMARLLHRPAYDFTKSYAVNRTRSAFGCYHCHRVRE